MALRTDFNIAQLPNASPFSGLLGKNTVVTDPIFGTQIVRVTDGSSGTGKNGSEQLGNSGSATSWNTDDTLMFFTSQGNVKFLVQFDPVTMKCTQLGGPGSNYSFAGGGAFSKVSPGVLYIFSPAGFPTAIQKLTYTLVGGVWTYQSTTTVCDFSNAAGGPLPVGYKANWNSILTCANDDSIFTVGFSEGVQQTGYYVCAYKVGVGFRMLDTRNGAVTGSWGATGTATISSVHGLTFPFYLHDVQQFPNPTYSELSNTPTGGHIICWATAGLTLVDGGNTSDHSGKGATGTYWNRAAIGGGSNTYANFDTIVPIGTFAIEPAGQHPPQTFIGNPHYSLRPTNNDSIAIAWMTYAQPVAFPFSSCWQGEVTGFDVTGGVSGSPGTMYRACHTHNSYQPVNNQGIAVASQSGKFVAFSSDMAGSGPVGPLGSTSGGATGRVGIDARIDVFIVAVTVIPGLATSHTSLAADVNPANQGDVVTLSALVTSPGTNQPTGIVVFYDGTTALDSSVIDPSSQLAIVTIPSFAAGAHSLTAVYGGDGFNFQSTSPALIEIIVAVPPVAPPAVAPRAPFDLLLNKLAAVMTRDVSGGDGYGQADPSFATVATGVPCRISTASVSSDMEFRAKSKEDIAFKKVFLRPWFLDPSVDGSYAPNHVVNGVTYNTQPLTHGHWLQIDGDMYDIYELHNPGGLDHHLEVLCRMVLV